MDATMLMKTNVLTAFSGKGVDFLSRSFTITWRLGRGFERAKNEKKYAGYSHDVDDNKGSGFLDATMLMKIQVLSPRMPRCV